jgi:hypothetical protein
LRPPSFQLASGDGTREHLAVTNARDGPRADWWLRSAIATALLAAVPILAALLGVLLDFDPLRLEKRCEDRPFSCGVGTGLLVTVLAVGVGVIYWSGWRRDRVLRRYKRLARTEPESLVPGFGSARNSVRHDDLFELVTADLRAERRRPQIIVGGIGGGKTTALVGLTQALADDRHNVPVPIDAAGAERELDFLELARIAFLRHVQPWFLREDEGFAVWQRVCHDGRLVVLADGLGNALRDQEHPARTIARAIERSGDENFGLVIAARPEDVPAGLNVARFALEPLDVEKATDFVLEEAGVIEGRELVAEFLRRTCATETPFYLHYVAELLSLDRLADLRVQQRSRFGLRLDLMQAYLDALVAGEVCSEARLLGTSRGDVVAVLGDTALAGLAAGERQTDLARPGLEDPRRVAADAEALGLVHVRGTVVEFPHSILRGYLAARRIGGRKAPVAACHALLKLDREAIVAAAMAGGVLARTDPPAAAEVAHAILEAAGNDTRRAIRSTRFVLATAAADIATVLDASRRAPVLERLADLLDSSPHSGGTTSWGPSKIELAGRLGKLGGPESCRGLWTLALDEDYGVRLSAARELAGLGDTAVASLRSHFAEHLRFAEMVYGSTIPGAPPGNDHLVTADESLPLGVQCWILPTLRALAAPTDEWTGKQLERWVRIRWGRAFPGTEASLAQGFKLAAMHSIADGHQDELVRAAALLLTKARFWYSRISLLQALAVWEARSPRRHGEAAAVIEQYVNDQHELVRRTARLCALGLRSELRPRVWGDEVMVSRRPRYPAGDSFAAQGWLELDPEAARLMGDVIVALNLISGDSRAADRHWERLLAACGPKLAACMRGLGERNQLLQVLGTAAVEGSPCDAACGQQLCPYPARSQPTFRGELPEGFCRALARFHKGNDAMVQFWQDMETRVRT